MNHCSTSAQFIDNQLKEVVVMYSTIAIVVNKHCRPKNMFNGENAITDKHFFEASFNYFLM